MEELRYELKTNLVAKTVFSCLFGLAWVLGNAYFQADSIRYVIDNPVISIAGFLVGALLCFISTTLVFFAITKLAHTGKGDSTLPRSRVVFISSLLICLLCWIPFILAFFPGSITWDGTRELQSYYGLIEWTTHHPVFPTLLMGFITDIGAVISGGSSSAAVFTYTLCYALLQGTVCAAIVKEVLLLSRSRALAVITLLFFCIVPLFGANAQTMWKDNLYMCFFALFFIQLIRCFRADTINTKMMVFCLAAGLCAALCRKEGIVIVGISLLVLLLIRRGEWQRLTAGLGALVLIFGAWTYLLIPGLGIKAGSSVEAFTMPMQQTARIVTYHGDVINEEEYEVLSRCWDYDAIPALYEPSFADPIKNAFNKEYLSEYLMLYAEMGISHPLYYLDGYCASSYGYWYLGHIGSVPPVVVTFTEQTLERPYVYDYPESLAGLREALVGYTSLWTESPILAQFLLPGIYVWVVLMLGLFLFLRTNRRALLIVLPLILSILVATISPVNAYLRYIFGVVIVIFLLLAFCVTWYREEERPMSSVRASATRSSELAGD